MISGAVAGLGTITPASGFVLPWHGLVIGIIAGAMCFYACTSLKELRAELALTVKDASQGIDATQRSESSVKITRVK